MKTMTIQQVGLCVDAIYTNYSKSKISQKNTNQLAAGCGVSVASLTKIKKILADMTILLIEGERAAQTCLWNPCKCGANDVLVREVYKIYTSDAKTRVKVENKKRSSLEGALELKQAMKASSERLRLMVFVLSPRLLISLRLSYEIHSWRNHSNYLFGDCCGPSPIYISMATFRNI